jgi:hypothetical protein
MLWCNVTISIICLIVCIATSRSEVTRNPKTNLGEGHGVAAKMQVVPLITLL